MATSMNQRDFTGRSTVAGLFTDRAHAQQAIADLKAAGFTEDQIGVAVRDRDEQGQLMSDTGTHATSGAGKGAVGGGILGGLVGLLVGVGALAIPGIGPVVAGGIFAHAIGATAVGAGIGAVGGGIIGVLTHLGIPEHEAKHFETGFNAGGTLVTVNAQSRINEAVEIMERDGGDTGAAAYGDTTTGASYAEPASVAGATAAYGATTPNTGAGDYARTGTTNSGEQRVQLHEEVLDAQKERVQAGEVTLRKEVITETRSIDVPVTREEVVIERHAVTGQAAAGADFGKGEEVIRVPVSEEQVIVSKTPIVTEEITLGKREVHETQHVQDTVRREEAHLENPDNVDVLQRGNAGIGSEVDADEVDTASTRGANR